MQNHQETPDVLRLMIFTLGFALGALLMHGCAKETCIRGVYVYRTVPGVPSDLTIDRALGYWQKLHGKHALDGLNSISFHDELLSTGVHGLYEEYRGLIWVYWRRECVDLAVLYHELAHHAYSIRDEMEVDIITQDLWPRLLMAYHCYGGELFSLDEWEQERTDGDEGW